jgi:hypothetical protein
MNFKRLMAELIFSMVLVVPGLSLAAHPLITDDAGTQGKGKFQLELNGQYDSENESAGGVSTKTTGGEVAAALSYGIAENVDLVLNLPYQWGKTEENEATSYDEKGISDTILEVKWRFFEKAGVSLALKPGIIFPTGNDEKGLGSGKIGGKVFLIASKELGPWAFHANIGYIRNENKADEIKDLWHASLAATWGIVKDLKLVANIGIERNPDNTGEDNPAFLIGGLIYSILENVDIDCGIKYGLNSSETDYSLMAGIAIRF